MTQVRECKYGCNTQLGEFDTTQNKYLELDGTLHTRERCESLKQGTKGHEEKSRVEGKKKITTIDGIAALEMIECLERGGGFYFQEGEHKGSKILEVYTSE